MKGKTADEQGEIEMSNNDWVQAHTPREDEWADEQTDYGVPVSPVEWDDYAAEQSVPVPPPVVAEPEPYVEPAAEPEIADEPEADEQVFVAEEQSEPAAEEWTEEVVAEETAVVEDGPAVEDVPVVEETVEIDEAPAPGHVPFGRPVDAPPLSDDGEVEQTARVVSVVEEEPPAEEEATALLPAAALSAAPEAAAGPALAGLYRVEGEGAPSIDQTQRIDLAEEAAEEQRIADQLRAEKEARDQRLGLVATSDANAVRAATPLPRPGVGRFASFGLLVLRLITAGILGIIGYQILSNIDASAELLGRTLLPEPRLLSWIAGFGLAALAVLLVIGLAVRVVGLLMTVLAAGSLAFLRWGAFSVFRPGVDGFIGDRDLLLAGVGILFFCVGGGRAGVDAAFSIARWRAKEAKRS